MSRKDDHVAHALEQYTKTRTNDFDEVRLIHHSLQSVDYQDISIRTQIGSIELEVPFYINAMTGGTEKTKQINQQLATVAKAVGCAMAVGSMSVAMKDETQWDSFSVVRDTYPEGVLFANLNPNYSTDDAKRAVDKIKANALQVHINAAQEIVMTEGDRSFSHWKESIHSLVNFLNVDVIVKEVGFGMSKKTIEQLMSLGVTIIDVSGKGGTNFIKIENQRRPDSSMNYLNEWGQSTVESLLEAYEYRHSVDLVASGGLRHPLDFVKAFVLGAKAVGISGLVLSSLINEGVDATIEMLNRWKEELKLIMSLVGARSIGDLASVDFILSSRLNDYCVSRKITREQISG